MRTLYVAAGGGGDAVGALLARRALGDTDERPPLVTTCAWERLRIDPVPGPRARSDFTGLGLVGGDPCEVLESSDTVPSGRSVLPRLAETSGARIFLHDFVDGARGLAGQLQRLARSLEVDHLAVVDVGGDIVARGHEPPLRSPLADSLTLMAALNVDIPASVVVVAPGADGELAEAEVLSLMKELGAEKAGDVTAIDVVGLGATLSWHPTEASALAAAAAQGVRGSVSMRRGRTPVSISDRTPQVWVVADPHAKSFPIAQALLGAASLSAAEEAVRAVAVNEIDLEKDIARAASVSHTPLTIAQLVHEMRAVGATHLTSRRLAEALGEQPAAEAMEWIGEPEAGLWSLRQLTQLSVHRERPQTSS